MLTPEAVASSKDTIHTLIIGTNRGIGLELARGAKARGQKVYATCRKPSDELKALDATRMIEGVDITKADDIEHLDGSLEGVTLDRLIINAGILKRTSLDDPDFDAVRRQFEVNAMGPLRVAAAIHHRLKDGGKLAILTSRMGSIADNDSGGRYGYRASKAALNAFGKSLAVDLAPRGIAVAQLHPGYVQTRMVNFGGLITPDEAAAGIAARIEALTLETSGGFWHSNGEALPW